MVLEYADLAPDWPEIKKRVGRKLHRTAKQIAVGKERECEA